MLVVGVEWVFVTSYGAHYLPQHAVTLWLALY